MKLMQLLPVTARRNSRNLDKRPEEVGVIAESALKCDTVQAFIAEHLLTGKHHTAIQYIVIYTPVRESCKLVGKI